jgi:hypothetical protein
MPRGISAAGPARIPLEFLIRNTFFSCERYIEDLRFRHRRTLSRSGFGFRRILVGGFGR